MQRIVITSSAVTVTVPQSKPTIYTDQDWNLSSVKVIEEMDNKSPPGTAYIASKTLAEKGGFLNILFFGLALTHFLHSAAWDFYEQHKAQIKWDLVTILPAMVSLFTKMICNC